MLSRGVELRGMFRERNDVRQVTFHSEVDYTVADSFS